MRRLMPPRPVIDRRNSLTDGLVACFVADGSGRMVDLCRRVRLNTIGSANTVSTPFGRAGNCVGAPKGFNVTAPAHLKLNYPITLVWVGVPQSPYTGASLFGIDYNSTGGAPYVSFVLSTNGSGVIGSDYGNNSSFTTITGTTNTSTLAGKLSVFGVSIRVGGSVLYVNGKQEATGSVSTNPTFTSTSLLKIGTFANSSNNGFGQCLIALMYNRVLTASEHVKLSADPFQVFQQTRAGVTLAKPSAAAGISPAFLRYYYSQGGQ